METLLRDVRLAVRSLGRQRGFTLAALTTLALGIGANAAMFSIVYGLVLRPLPYPDSDAIVRVGQLPAGMSRSTLALNNYSMQLLLDEAESFEQLAAYTPLQAEWAVREGSVRLQGMAVSPALFPLLRARPRLGRLFTEEEARDGADQVVLLSYDTWATRIGGDPDVVGTVLEIGGVARAVVGVLAEGCFFPSPDTEIRTLASRRPAPAGRRCPRRLLAACSSCDPRRSDGCAACRVVVDVLPGRIVHRGVRRTVRIVVVLMGDEFGYAHDH